MTILQALAARYEREANEGRAPVPGFGPAQISFAIVLDGDGRVVGVDDMRTGDGKKLRPLLVPSAPQPPKRTVAVASGTFWDKTSYVFGRTALDPSANSHGQARDAARTVREHAAFVTRHHALLAETEDEACVALLRFLQAWRPDAYDALDHAVDMLDQNVAFRLQGEAGFVHDRPGARAALLAEAADADGRETGTCLVTGAERPIARLHPSIKGVPGAQSSGAALVSFNHDAFTSYGKTQGGNAPVSEAIAFAYATSLNALLASSGTNEKGWANYSNRVRLGNVTVVFWAELDEAEAIARGMFAPDETTETDAVREVLRAMEAGRPIREADPKLDPATRVYVLGLSANAARLSVRFWMEQTLGDFIQRFAEHWADLRIEPPPRSWPPTMRALLLELAARGEAENIPDHLNGEFTRAILTGLPYPRSLLSQALMRVRADGGVSALRVALIKAVLARGARKANPDRKDTLVALDRDETNIGYRLGRLFALLDYAQYLSVGSVNAGVKEKFFASASATPGRVFPSILRTAQYHLSDARKSPEKERGASWADAEIKQVMDGLSATRPFPPTLGFDDQGRFVVGYYHQRRGRAADARSTNAETSTDEDS